MKKLFIFIAVSAIYLNCAGSGQVFASVPGELPRADHQTLFAPAGISVAPKKESLNDLEHAASYYSSASATAQRRGRLVLGGTFGMSFGNYTNINVSPQVGYRFNQYFTLGGGVSYNYYDHHDRDYTLNYFGMHLYTRIYPVRFISLYAQPELQRRWGTVRGERNESELFACLLLGGGFVLPVSYTGSISVTFYYDVLQNDYSPHGNKIGYSVGYIFGF